MSVVEPPVVKTELLPVFVKLSKDDQDSVRLLSVDACVHIAKALPPADNVSAAAVCLHEHALGFGNACLCENAARLLLTLFSLCCTAGEDVANHLQSLPSNALCWQNLNALMDCLIR